MTESAGAHTECNDSAPRGVPRIENRDLRVHGMTPRNEVNRRDEHKLTGPDRQLERSKVPVGQIRKGSPIAAFPANNSRINFCVTFQFLTNRSYLPKQHARIDIVWCGFQHSMEKKKLKCQSGHKLLRRDKRRNISHRGRGMRQNDKRETFCVYSSSMIGFSSIEGHMI